MSYTQVYIAEIEKAQSAILELTSITRDQYSEMMFIHGSAFAEHFCRTFLNSEDMVARLLQCSLYGYWDWFRMIYQHDDTLIIKKDCLNIPHPDGNKYYQMKDCLIGDDILENDLYQYISEYL